MLDTGEILANERTRELDGIVVTAAQMSAIEGRIFQAGMPVAALMEKVAIAIARRLQQLYLPQRVTVCIGPGHNGGDAAVVARELHLHGYAVSAYRPLSKSKPLTRVHTCYLASLGVRVCDRLEDLPEADLVVDGLFGFGLQRPISGDLAAAIDRLNDASIPVVSIDLPSGIHTDTGEVLGTAVRADRTFCLGLWKLAFCQDPALAFVGAAELIDFGIPLADVGAVTGQSPPLHRVTATRAMEMLPVPRSATTYKYKEGHLLLACGSRRYTGAAVLTGLGARSSGVGMLTMAVPDSIKPLLSLQLPEAIVLGCPETESGAMASLPADLALSDYDAIAVGPGLTREAESVVRRLWEGDRPLILDADGLNVLASQKLWHSVPRNITKDPTILTPHPGEFKRLFPDIEGAGVDAARSAARDCGAIVVYKGARPAIAHPDGSAWLVAESTPALARGGSGDVLTGLVGGLVAQAVKQERAIAPLVAAAVGWHAAAGLAAERDRGQLGVDASTLAEYLHLGAIG